MYLKNLQHVLIVLSFTIDGHVQVSCVRPVVNSRYMHNTTRTQVPQCHEASCLTRRAGLKASRRDIHYATSLLGCSSR
jgi:hypothetical protein